MERDVRGILDKTSTRCGSPRSATPSRKTASAVASTPWGDCRGIAYTIASSFAVYSGRNRLTHRTRMPAPLAVLAGRCLGAGFLTSTPELAALAALPRDLAMPGLDRARAKSMPTSVAIPTGGRRTKTLGTAEIGGHGVALSVPDSRYHLHVIGSTGSGKTTLLVNMAVDDITAGCGTVVIDPHGDMVLDVLDRLLASVADRVVLFDPFAKARGPQMDDVMGVACLTLLRHANVTLQHIPLLLNSAQFRSAMTVNLDDPAGLSGFWQWYDELSPALRSQVIGPVLARLRAFLLRDFVKRAMRFPKFGFDMARSLTAGRCSSAFPRVNWARTPASCSAPSS